MPLPTYVEEFLEKLALEHKKYSTIKRYEYDLSLFFNWLRQNKGTVNMETFQEMNMDDFQAFTVEKKYSKSTLKRVLTVIKRLQLYVEETALTSCSYSIENIIPTKTMKPLSVKEIMTKAEYRKLMKTIPTRKDLSEHELTVHGLLVNRNISIIMLLYKYGLTLQEVHRLSMEDLSFIQNTLRFTQENGRSRVIHLTEKDMLQIYTYYHNIPEPVRPKYHCADPLFVAVDFHRKTYKWDYETNSPKRLHIRSIQKMFKKEIARAEIRPTMQIQYLRNAFIVYSLVDKKDKCILKKQLGISEVTLNRYIQLAKEKHDYFS